MSRLDANPEPAKVVFIDNRGDGLGLCPHVGTIAPSRDGEMFDVWIKGQRVPVGPENKPYFVQATDPEYPTLKEGPLL